MKKPSLPVLVVAAWALTLINYVINHPWNLFDTTLARSLNNIAGVVGTATFVAWLAILLMAFWLYRGRAWWLLLTIPFILPTFLSVALFVIASVLFPH